MLKPFCATKREGGGSGLGRPWGLCVGIVILWGLVLGFPGHPEAYEWMDIVQDRSPLSLPLEILQAPGPDLSDSAAMSPPQRFENSWFLRKRYLAVGDQQVGAELLDYLQVKAIDMGAKRLRPYSASLLREAEVLAELEQFEEAISRCRAAINFSPGLPEPHKVLAEIYWKQSKLNLMRVAAEWTEAGSAVVMGFDHAILLAANLSLLILAAGLVFFGVFYLVQLVRYYGLLQHDVFEILPGEPQRVWVAVTTCVCLVMPLLLGGGLYALCLLWVVLFWSYGTWKERLVHILFILFTVVVPFWIGVSEQGLKTLDSTKIQSMILHREGRSDEASVAALRALTERDPGDDQLFFMLGTAYKKRGEYGEARSAFERAISLKPETAIYYNNLGNTFYADHDHDRAVQMYQKAISVGPLGGSFHLNLSAAYREQFMLTLSEAEHNKALELDPELVSYYAETVGPSYNRMVIDETLSEKLIWTLFLGQLDPRRQEGAAGAAFPLGDFQSWAIPLFLVLALIAVHVVRRWWGITHRCVKCGRVYCRRCQTSVRPDSVCSQCVYIFEEHEGVDVKQRTKKIIEIRRHIDRDREAGRLVGILVPGGGHIFWGRICTGFLIIFIVVVCLVYGFFWDLLCQDPMVYRAVLWPGRLWLLVPASLAYGVSVYHLYGIRR